ncbi:hypothetical protein J2Z69_001940 [Paenibacillus shirakamiensis]|uniref:Uncharacterized protein n=1 Tax=Paenibacillus shirakamiensis TaxID=1265935 RepID=A0ABS4JGQ7_9BACL|nr:hypothetical protein [Paenibacillus shirakamiensis]
MDGEQLETTPKQRFRSVILNGVFRLNSALLSEFQIHCLAEIRILIFCDDRPLSEGVFYQDPYIVFISVHKFKIASKSI